MSCYLCNDLLVQIFESLPPKSIIRLTSLSKYWHSRLLSQAFLNNHKLKRSKNPPKTLIKHITYCDNDYEFKEIYTLHNHLPLDDPGYIGIPGVQFPYTLRTTELVGACNGLLCLQDEEVIISLWNVSVRRKVIVPRHPRLEICLKSPEVALGFGFCDDDYKVVGICYSGNNSTFIYSLKEDCWQEVYSSFTLPFKHRLLMACFFNGILHWVVVGKGGEDMESYYILTFNLSTCVFGHILFPRYWKVKQLTTLNGCLAVVCWEGGDVWKIWVMEEYNNVESWSVLYEFEAVVISNVIRVIQGVTNGELVAYYDGSKVCNLQTGLLRKVLNFGPDCYNMEMVRYEESFELLDNERATTCGETIFSWKDNQKRIRLSWVLDN